MLRRLVRSYYRLRYFPRLLTELLTRISNEVADLRRYEATELGRMMKAHEERVARIHEEIAAFCDDATHAMMSVAAGIGDLQTRMQTLQQAMQRLDNGSVDAQGRMAALQQSLAQLRAQPAHVPAPDAGSAMALAASNGSGPAAGDDDRLSHA